MRNIDTKKLFELYQNTSKHSNYQILPSSLKEIISEDSLDIHSRFENERMAFLNNSIRFENKRVMDIGGNTGFFSFEAVENGASEVVYVEGNTPHANFVEYAAELLNKNILVKNKYLDFEKDLGIGNFDIVLLFNVIHHLGDDFGDQSISIDNAKEKMVDCINYFVGRTDLLVLQMGYCWKGDTSKLLFENGTKKEMISFIESAAKGNWKIREIGIAEVNADKTEYRSLSDENMKRQDSIGEFRNRPIFIFEKISKV